MAKVGVGLPGVGKFDPKGEPSVVAAKWEQWRKSFYFSLDALGNVEEGRRRYYFTVVVLNSKTFSKLSSLMVTPRQIRAHTPKLLRA